MIVLANTFTCTSYNKSSFCFYSFFSFLFVLFIKLTSKSIR